MKRAPRAGTLCLMRRFTWCSLLSLLVIPACANSVLPRSYDDASVDAATARDGGRADTGTTAPDDAGARDAGPARTCDEGCAPLERCVDGICAPYPACAGDGSCPAGEICQRRSCLPADRDLDGDGAVAMDDCDEGDPSIHPGAVEDCNTVDDDCDAAVDEAIAPRACSSACGGGTESCEGGAWTGCDAVMPTVETCDGMDEDCDSRVDEGLTRGCSTACGSGTEMCVTGAWTTCTAPSPSPETCNGVDDDCDGVTDDGLTRSCSTACGSGSEICSAGVWGTCSAPPVVTETCNLVDDDCDGRCDDVPGGCRVGVHRSYNSASGEHFYTTSRTEAACCGFRVEFYDYFYLYAASNPGVQPLYRCVLSTGFHFYTRSSTCEGAPGSTVEGIMGYVGRAPGCGSTPLYRLVRGNDHFYTTSASERDSAVAGGYRLEGTEGHVWRAAAP